MSQQEVMDKTVIPLSGAEDLRDKTDDTNNPQSENVDCSQQGSRDNSCMPTGTSGCKSLPEDTFNLSKKIQKLLDDYRKAFKTMFGDPPKDQYVDAAAWGFAIKYLDNFVKQLKDEIDNLAGENLK